MCIWGDDWLHIAFFPNLSVFFSLEIQSLLTDDIISYPTNRYCSWKRPWSWSRHEYRHRNDNRFQHLQCIAIRTRRMYSMDHVSIRCRNYNTSTLTKNNYDGKQPCLLGNLGNLANVRVLYDPKCAEDNLHSSGTRESRMKVIASSASLKARERRRLLQYIILVVLIFDTFLTFWRYKTCTS